MKKHLLLLGLSFLLLSCSKENPSSVSREYFAPANVTLPADEFNFVTLNAGGDTRVFKFTFTHPDEPNIADDELSEVFWIEVPFSQNDFDIERPLEPGQLDNYEVFYQRTCFCGFSEAYQYELVKVKGRKKTNSTWEIDFELKVKYNDTTYSLKDSGIYTKSSL